MLAALSDQAVLILFIWSAAEGVISNVPCLLLLLLKMDRCLLAARERKRGRPEGGQHSSLLFNNANFLIVAEGLLRNRLGLLVLRDFFCKQEQTVCPIELGPITGQETATCPEDLRI